MMHISNFRPVKRVPDVIEVFARVQAEIPARLLLIGEGPEMGLVRNMVIERGLGERVCFLGKQEDVAEVISMADVMLLPSAKESFGLVALEAMACGVPVVATEAGGLPEVVTDGACGFLLPIGDVEGMAAATIRLLRDETMYRQFAQNSIERSNTTFCHELIASQYEDLYRQLLA